MVVEDFDVLVWNLKRALDYMYSNECEKAVPYIEVVLNELRKYNVIDKVISG